ncbi:UDP-4-amino-4-deoxy-L-arabinose--oxoglutarate aminotransferase [Streptomyces alboniger]
MAFTHPVSRPFLDGRELEYVTDAVSGGWISSQGPYVRRFEEAFAAWNGVAHGVACSSGTAALTLALRAAAASVLGDEVIVGTRSSRHDRLGVGRHLHGRHAPSSSTARTT